jgi:hypothetical protein
VKWSATSPFFDRLPNGVDDGRASSWRNGAGHDGFQSGGHDVVAVIEDRGGDAPGGIVR